jgi:hypothetical protein
MSSSEYQFVTRWRVVGTVDEVSQILEKPEDLPRWWPSVYLEARTVSGPAQGEGDGVGRVVRLRTKGWLPYTLSWQLKVVESRRPHGFTIESSGDFVGRGVWTFEQDGAWVDITFDWRLRVEKRGVKELSPLLKPIFSANHRWAMSRGEESLKLELARRRSDAAGRAVAPAPPGPTFASPWPLLLGAAAVLLGAVALAGAFARSRRSRRRSRRWRA